MQKYTKRTSCPKLLEPSNPRTHKSTYTMQKSSKHCDLICKQYRYFFNVFCLYRVFVKILLFSAGRYNQMPIKFIATRK